MDDSDPGVSIWLSSGLLLTDPYMVYLDIPDY